MNDAESSIDVARLRVMAVKTLGYTHSEYGLRPMHAIFAEMRAATQTYRLHRPGEETGDDNDWIEREIC